MATFAAKKFEKIEKQGLSDGAKYQLNCRDCDSPLAIIWQVNPHFRMRDGSVFCNSYSEEKKIAGEVRILEIVETEESEDGHVSERHITKFNDIIDFDESELCLIKMAKG